MALGAGEDVDREGARQGNRLREDDAVAWRVLEARAPQLGLPALKLRHAHQLMPEMAECVSRAVVLTIAGQCFGAGKALSPGSGPGFGHPFDAANTWSIQNGRSARFLRHPVCSD